MPEETTTPAAPAATPVTTPALAANPDPPAGDGTETISLEEARKIRSESTNMRKRLKAYEDAEEEKRIATLSEVERSKAEIAKAEKRTAEAEQRIQHYQQQLVTAQVKLAAQAKGIIDPDMAALAVASTLEYGEDGMPTNLEKALDMLIKNKPYLAPKPAELPEPSAPPAQPVNAQTVPTVPAFNVNGRTSIGQPGTLPSGKPMRLEDVKWSR